jgi:hypothetical protein
VESDFKSDKDQLKAAINSIVPAGGTNMREALYTAVKALITDAQANPDRDNYVKAVVLRTDGDWNVGGDPEGVNCGTIYGCDSFNELSNNGKGSVITWAAEHHIKIFTIALEGQGASDLTDLNKFEQELQRYSSDTGGLAKVYRTGDNLDNIYRDIAGALREEASINTKMSLDFSNVEVNAPATQSGYDVFEYMYINDPPKSTYVVPPAPSVAQIRDDTNNWTPALQKLTFVPGTIKVNQEWRVNITLRTRMEGNIKVLSSATSKVTFEGTEGSVDIPDTFITAIPPGTEKGPEALTFDIHFPAEPRKNDESDTKIAKMEWNVAYDGLDTSISQQIWVAPIYSEAYQYKDTITTPRAQDTVDYTLVISDLRPGRYKVKVIGHVSDANDDSDTAIINIPENLPDAKIKIGSYE